MILDAYCYFINDASRTHLVCICLSLWNVQMTVDIYLGKKYPFTLFQELDIILLPYLLGYRAYCAQITSCATKKPNCLSLFTTSFIPVLVTVLLLGLLACGTHLMVALYSCMSFYLSRSLAIQAIKISQTVDNKLAVSIRF